MLKGLKQLPHAFTNILKMVKKIIPLYKCFHYMSYVMKTFVRPSTHIVFAHCFTILFNSLKLNSVRNVTSKSIFHNTEFKVQVDEVYERFLFWICYSCLIFIYNFLDSILTMFEIVYLFIFFYHVCFSNSEHKSDKMIYTFL